MESKAVFFSWLQVNYIEQQQVFPPLPMDRAGCPSGGVKTCRG